MGPTPLLDRLYGTGATPYLDNVEAVLRKAQTHPYRFYSDDAVPLLMGKQPTPPEAVATANYICAFELLEKAHLCAVGSILRSRSWLYACAREYEAGGYFGFASAARGLIEAAGDTLDGLRA